jgi:DNA-binding response OmpR family regulator
MREKIHVLLIEDGSLDACLVKGMLERSEHAVFTVDHVPTFEDGRRALSLSSTHQVILLDLGLSDSAGLQTLRRVMPLAREASVVVLTALEDEELGIAAVREGAYDYLVKGQVDARHLTCSSLLRRAQKTALRAARRNRAPHPRAASPATIRAALSIAGRNRTHGHRAL